MTRVCIVAAKRTPQGRFMGALAKRSAVDLGIAAGKAALETIDPTLIDQVIVGNVISAGLGMNIARQIGVKLGIPVDCPAFSVNMMCASGMQSVILAAQAIAIGQARVVLCGGTESMSNAPFILDRARAGYKLGDGVLIDSLLRDGLVDTFDNEHMGLTAEGLAEQYQISREAQDTFALRSQLNTAKAYAEGHYRDELIIMPELDADEHPRADTTLEKLAMLRPAFKPNGTVTAGNASGINDAAAMLVVCDEQTAREQKWQPLATITTYSSAGCEPRLMGLGPVHATRLLCERSKLKVSDFDMIELNEAFAVQSLVCIKELALNTELVNPDGGAIALGHPIGASGARLLVHVAHAIATGRSKRALATLCVGGGMGAAVVLV